MQEGNTFERIEKKWRMTPQQLTVLMPVIREHMREDSHGKTTICSEFYDTADFYLIRKSIERPLFKEKIRIRSYGIPAENSEVFVEVKRKLNGIGSKRRIRCTYKNAKELMKGKEIDCDNKQIEKEILNLVSRYSPRPAASVFYERIAFFSTEDENLRITLDFDIRYRFLDTDLTKGAEGEEAITDERKILMEVKSDKGVPAWLREALTKAGVYRAPFSKIGTVFTEHFSAYEKQKKEYEMQNKADEAQNKE